MFDFFYQVFMILCRGKGLSMRLFIAVNFTQETKNRLAALSVALQSRSTQGNFCAPDNFHLTLAFLGECGVKQAREAEYIVEHTYFDSFLLTVDHFGRFIKGTDIWWAGIKKTNDLVDLHQKVNKKLINASFILDNRPFSPHITLGREVITNIYPWKIEPFHQDVNCIHLMKSERIGGRLTYTSLCRNSNTHD